MMPPRTSAREEQEAASVCTCDPIGRASFLSATTTQGLGFRGHNLPPLLGTYGYICSEESIV